MDKECPGGHTSFFILPVACLTDILNDRLLKGFLILQVFTTYVFETVNGCGFGQGELLHMKTALFQNF